MKTTDTLKLYIGNIIWDTDDEEEKPDLPSDLTITEPAEKFLDNGLCFDPDTKDFVLYCDKIDIADYLSDKYGWCVKSCDVPKLEKVIKNG